MLLVPGPHTEIHCAKILLNFGKELHENVGKGPIPGNALYGSENTVHLVK